MRIAEFENENGLNNEYSLFGHCRSVYCFRSDFFTKEKEDSESRLEHETSKNSVNLELILSDAGRSSERFYQDEIVAKPLPRCY